MTHAQKWRNVPSCSNYQVNKLGQVRNKSTGQVLAIHSDSKGHLVVNIKIDGYGTSRRVSRLVGEVFCQSYSPDLFPSYRNGNPNDCSPSNLLWVARQQVTGHPYSRNPKRSALVG